MDIPSAIINFNYSSYYRNSENLQREQIRQKKRNLEDDVVLRLRSASDWLGNDVRKPFQLLIDEIVHIISKDSLQSLSGERIRNYVDHIIQHDIPLQKLIDISHNKGELSDGYHTFYELYYFRMLYNAALFNEWGKHIITVNEWSPIHGKIKKSLPTYNVHKSKKHHDGELCFGGGWFIVVAVLPTGQISNHYEEKYWDLFQIPETEKALFEFDGHNASDVANRLEELVNKK